MNIKKVRGIDEYIIFFSETNEKEEIKKANRTFVSLMKKTMLLIQPNRAYLLFFAFLANFYSYNN